MSGGRSASAGHETTESQSFHSVMSSCGFLDCLLVRRQIHTGYIAVKALSIPVVTGHKARVTASPNYLHLGFGLTAGERKGTFTLFVAFEIVSLHCAV